MLTAAVGGGTASATSTAAAAAPSSYLHSRAKIDNAGAAVQHGVRMLAAAAGATAALVSRSSTW